MSTMDAFEKDLEGLLNRHSRENASNTPISCWRATSWGVCTRGMPG